MVIEPYLFFDGRCEEAIEFYKKALDAQVQMMMRFNESPEQHPGPVNPEKIMHASLKIGDTRVMCSDGECSGKPSFEGFSLSVAVANEAEAKKRFDALADGGKVRMPLTKTFYASSFGMLTDRFGVGWMVIAEKK